MSLQSKCLFVITIDENPTWSSWLEICSVYHSPAYSQSEKSTIVSVIALLLDFIHQFHQWLLPLKLWVRFLSVLWGVLDTTSWDNVCQAFATDPLFSSGIPVFIPKISLNGRHDLYMWYFSRNSGLLIYSV